MSLHNEIDRLLRRTIDGGESARVELRQSLEKHVLVILSRALRSDKPRSAINRRLRRLAKVSSFEPFLTSHEIEELVCQISHRLSDILLRKPAPLLLGDDPPGTEARPIVTTIQSRRR